MRTQHTRQQIIEAIKYWQKRLDESKSPLLDVFSKEFGEDAVFGQNGKERICPTIEIIDKIYELANKVLFESRLTIRPIKLIDTMKHAFASYVYADVKLNGKRVLVNHPFTALNGSTYYPPFIEMPSFILHIRMPFMYLASIIIHEMIHQYTVELSNEIQLKYDDIENGKKHNPHGDEFKKLMDNINEEHGTSIAISCNIADIKQEFDKSIEAAQKMHESEENRNIIYQDEYMIIEKPGEDDIYVTHIF